MIDRWIWRDAWKPASRFAAVLHHSWLERRCDPNRVDGLNGAPGVTLMRATVLSKIQVPTHGEEIVYLV